GPPPRRLGRARDRRGACRRDLPPGSPNALPCGPRSRPHRPHHRRRPWRSLARRRQRAGGHQADGKPMRRRSKIAIAIFALLFPVGAHLLVGRVARIPAPDLPTPRFVASADGQVRRTPRGWTISRGVHIAYLAGSPEEIGAQHTALLYDRMAADERVLWDG